MSVKHQSRIAQSVAADKTVRVHYAQVSLLFCRDERINIEIGFILKTLVSVAIYDCNILPSKNLE